MTCKICERTDLTSDEMLSELVCEACFDKMMQDEAIDMEIFDSQKGICFLCNTEMIGWITKEFDGAKRAICYPSCTNKFIA